MISAMENLSRVRGCGCVIQGGPKDSEKVAFKQIADGNEGVKHMDTWEKSWLCDL